MRAGYRGCASASRGRSQPVARIAAKVNAAATFLVDPGGRGDSGSGDVAVHLGDMTPARPQVPTPYSPMPPRVFIALIRRKGWVGSGPRSGKAVRNTV